MPSDLHRRATTAYVGPFVAFVAMMAAEKSFSLPAVYFYPLRFAVVLALLVTLSRPYIKLRPGMPLASIAIGVAVFAIWIAPDELFGYRHHWLFENSITGTASSSLQTWQELRSYTPHLLPEAPHWENYSKVFDAVPFARWMLNSFLIVLLTVPDSGNQPPRAPSQ